MIGFPVLVMVMSDILLLNGTFPKLRFARMAARRLFKVEGLQDFCIFATGYKSIETQTQMRALTQLLYAT
jgi:hypothetical protein